MRPRRRGSPRQGFTLVELMIVLSIIAVIAALAIPDFMRFQLKAKTVEAKTNLVAIKAAEESYFAEFGRYVGAAPSPPSNGGRSKQAFLDTGVGGSSFATIGWFPEGRIYFNYAVEATDVNYTADATADLDGDANDQVWGFVRESSTGATLTGALGCTGVWNGIAANTTETVGPCGLGFGQSVF